MTGSYIKKLMTGIGQAINKTKANVPQGKTQQAIRDLKLGIEKLKGQKAILSQTDFELKNKMPITFKGSKKKSESNTEAYQRIQKDNTKVLKGMIDKATTKKVKSDLGSVKVEKKAMGGRMGYKDGTKGGGMSDTQVKKKFRNLGNLPESIQIKIAGKKIAKKV